MRGFQCIKVVLRAFGAVYGKSKTPSIVDSAKQSLFFVMELAAVDVSLVDHKPEELMLLTATGLHIDLADGIGPKNSFVSRRLSIDSIQIDDQVASSRFPVLLTTAAVESEEGGVASPLLQLTMVCQPGGIQGQVGVVICCPCFFANTLRMLQQTAKRVWLGCQNLSGALLINLQCLMHK